MYLLQAYDAQNSAKAFRNGEHETNPMMKPFSHGGAPTMALGFAGGDLLRNALLKHFHATPATESAVDGAQALQNALGIMQTDRNMPHAAVQMPGPLPTPPPQTRRTL